MWPWSVARRTFAPDDLSVFDRLALARSAIGLAVLFWVHSGYEPSYETFFSSVDGVFVNALWGAGVLAVCLVVLLATADERSGLVGRAPVLIRPFLVALGFYLFFTWLTTAFTYRSFYAWLGSFPWFLTVVLYLLFVWLTLFQVFAMWYVSRFWFRAGDVHALLPPLVGTIVVLLVAVPKLLSGAPSSSGVPQSTETIILATGTASSVLLALAEIVALHRRGRRSNRVEVVGERR